MRCRQRRTTKHRALHCYLDTRVSVSMPSTVWRTRPRKIRRTASSKLGLVLPCRWTIFRLFVVFAMGCCATGEVVNTNVSRKIDVSTQLAKVSWHVEESAMLCCHLWREFRLRSMRYDVLLSCDAIHASILVSTVASGAADPHR